MSGGRGVVALFVACALATGCFRASWRSLAGGEVIAPGRIVLTGSVRVVPPIEQRNPSAAPGTVLLPGSERRLLMLFTRDLSAPFKEDDPLPVAGSDSAWIPSEGRFFIEVPAAKVLFVRALLGVTDAGRTALEVPLKVELAGAHGVVDIGEITVVRGPGERVVVRRAPKEARGRALSRWPAMKWSARTAERLE